MHLVSAESMRSTHQCPLRNPRTAISDAPLGTCALTKWCLKTHAETEQTSLSDHNTIIDAEPAAFRQSGPFMNENFFSLPLICGKNLTTALLRHDAHHLLQPLITCGELPPDQLERCGSFRDSVRTSNTTHNQDFLAADVGHRTLRDLNQHSVDSLLQREAEVLRRDDIFAVIVGWTVWSEAFVRRVCFRGRQDAGQAYVHAFGSIRKWQQTLSPVSCQHAQRPRGETRTHFLASCSML